MIGCLGEVLGVGGYEEVASHAVEITLPMGIIRILDLDTLIKAKEAMGRPHDLITVQHLRLLRQGGSVEESQKYRNE